MLMTRGFLNPSRLARAYVRNLVNRDTREAGQIRERKQLREKLFPGIGDEVWPQPSEPGWCSDATEDCCIVQCDPTYPPAAEIDFGGALADVRRQTSGGRRRRRGPAECRIERMEATDTMMKGDKESTMNIAEDRARVLFGLRQFDCESFDCESMEARPMPSLDECEAQRRKEQQQVRYAVDQLTKADTEPFARARKVALASLSDNATQPTYQEYLQIFRLLFIYEHLRGGLSKPLPGVKAMIGRERWMYQAITVYEEARSQKA